MNIDNSIEKMEEALDKKKKLRAEKDKARLVTLEERIKAKTEKAEKIQLAITDLNEEKEQVQARIKEAGEVVDAEMPGIEAKDATDEKTKPYKRSASKGVAKKAPPQKRRKSVMYISSIEGTYGK